MTRIVIRTVCAAIVAASAAAVAVGAWAASQGAASPPGSTGSPGAAGSSKAGAGAQNSGGAVTAPPAVPSPIVNANIQVKVKVIHAQRSGRFIDQHARKIEKLLKPLFNFASYRMVRREVMTLAHGVSTRVPMPFRVGVHIKQEGLQDKKILLSVQIGQKQSVKLRLEDGGTFLQGVTLKNGQSYILAISASSLPVK